ncbi:arabinosyltransferase domain-containing protein [Allokutzneria sp. NRRL B-24872]|uniref:arabinosyltransferase domain-containing protein n=1 Tax=Allokutzneria sp. NRRL B-24872 TaxID=1137961 RepID=UPI000A378A88|nr:arabinosyltransferase domain-containing protein [Allokutzneria sp. NRRL B-24872]
MPQRLKGQHRVTAWVLVGAAVITAVLAVLLPLAPVRVQQPVLSWPEAGAQPRSTVVPLVPYRPLEMTAELPSRTMDALDRSRFTAGGKWADVLTTLPEDENQPVSRGLRVQTRGGEVRISASEQVLLSERRPAGVKDYRFVATSKGVSVLRDGKVVADRPGLLPPQVAMLETAAENMQEANGLSAKLNTDARFQSAPATLKLVLLVLHALCLFGCLWLCVSRYRYSERARRETDEPRFKLGLIDIAVPAILVLWAIIGPFNDDDGWYLRHALNIPNSGYVGNYYHSFNAPEAPFMFSQYLLGAWGLISKSTLWMRMFPTVIGIAVWFVLRRYLHAALGGRRSVRRPYTALPYLLALAFLVWWMPFELTLRPEPVVCLGVAVNLALTEYARRREWPGLYAVAVAVAALTTLTTATGVVAWGPLLLHAPHLVRYTRNWAVKERIAYLGMLLVSGTAAFPAVFWDMKLSDLIETTRIHTWYWFVTPWYQEIERYNALLHPGTLGNWAKRGAVLLTVVALVFVVIRLATRRDRNGPLDRLIIGSAAMSGIGLAALAISPTKWVHHFGGMAVPAILVLALTAFASPIPARVRRTAPGLLAGGVAAFATVVIFSGTNSWHAFSDWGQPFGDHVSMPDPAAVAKDPNALSGKQLLEGQIPHVGPLKFSNMLLWLAVIGLCWWLARRAMGGGGRRWAALGTARLFTVVQTALVVLMLAVFVIAPINQHPQWSPAKGNLKSVIGGSCGLADELYVPLNKLTPVLRGPDRPALRDAKGAITVRELVRDQPTFVDWPIGLAYPCVPVLPVKDGMTTPAEYRLVASDQLGGTRTVTLNERVGGTQAFMNRVATIDRVPVDVVPTKTPRAPWGHLERVVYRHPPGRYTVSRTERVEWGLVSWPRLAQFDYVGARDGWLNE